MEIFALKNRIEELVLLAKKTLNTKFPSQYGGEYVDSIIFNELRSSSLSFIKNLYGSDHPYYIEFNTRALHAEPVYVEHGLGVLMGIKNELEGGWLVKVKELVTAEVFSDFLEMSEYLLQEKYKDSAAVMIGSVLEGHLRQLCSNNEISVEIVKDGKPIPKKAEMLNSELAAANIYNKLDQKGVTSWFDLRNKAAHGKYEEYTKEQVDIMYQGVLNFINRNT
jgi:hypothetical protein